MVSQRTYHFARLSALFLAIGTLAACASAPLPEEQMALSRSAVNRAVSAEATQYAPLEMKSAQDKLSLMDRAVGEQKPAQVRLLAEQIEVDANLAERKAQAVKSQKQLQAARNGIQVLRQEMLQAPDTVINSSSDDTL
ncbi:MAG: hypothetical protein JWP80_1700 [Pseudomonas sp.]|nr:hypothetical protein [Pseudomonas sp.]